MKQLTNQMCREKGLSVAVKGKNFYGESLEQGKKVRDKKLSDTFHLNVSKEAILDECERQNGSPDQGKVDPEFEQYYREVEEALGRSTGGDSESQKREPKTQDGKIPIRAKLQESQARVDASKAEGQRKERQNKRTGRDDR